MENVGINTAQNVTINYQIASVGDRILATLLDYLIFVAYFALIFFLANLTDGFYSSVTIWVLVSLPILLYDLYCELIFNGQSFGKVIMKIKVVMLNGGNPNFGGYLLRWLFRIIDMRIFSGVIAIITVAINGKGQRIGDIVAGTTVIRLKQKVTLKDTILSRVEESYTITFREVEQLTDKDVAIIKDVLTHSLKNQNWTTISKLAEKTRNTLNVSTTLNDIQFLNTVITDYSNYQFER